MEKEKKAHFTDLSVPRKQTPPASMLKVDILSLQHKEGTKTFASFFGIKA